MQAQSIDFLVQMPIDKMPSKLWLKMAWSLAVGGPCAQKTQILDIRDGLWSVSCHSTLAVKRLENPKAIIETLQALSRRRPLPPITAIQVVMGQLEAEEDLAPRPDIILDDARIPPDIDEPCIRRVLSRFLIKMDETYKAKSED